MNTFDRPAWRLPRGVTRGLWDYVNRRQIAEDYDNYFSHSRLFEFDEQILLEHFTKPNAWVADLGCGTGRALVPLVKQGLKGLAIDLSESMLHIVQEKADIDDLPIECVRCNLVELDAMADACVDYAMCLFSTLGMIRGRENRATMLQSAFRMLKPGGKFVVHAHNRMYSLFDPGGPVWLLRNHFEAVTDRDIELGDKWFHYRGVQNMFLHLFSKRELLQLVRAAGFQVRQVICLDAERKQPLRHPWWLGRIRANGYIVVGEKV